MAFIYQIINDINDKIYVGKTELPIEKRFKQHCLDAFRERNENRPLYNAMKKYGIEHFYIELLEECDNPEEREQFWIIQKNSYKNGYNATLGGDGKKYIDYDLVIDTYKELKSVVETAKKLQIDQGWVSKILKQNGIEIVFNPPHPSKVAQVDINTNEILNIFNSASEADKYFGGGRGHIGSVCLGKRKTAHGYKWKYV